MQILEMKSTLIRKKKGIMKSIRIAIDGPASSGKSTVAKIIAKNLGYTYPVSYTHLTLPTIA